MHLEEIEKTRADDFLEEVRLIDQHLTGQSRIEQLGFERAAETMLVLAAGHESQRTGTAIRIDHSAGYNLDALSAL
jgi:hypothetical protein